MKNKQERYGLEFLAADRHDRYCELVAAAEQRQEKTQKEGQIVHILLEWEDYLTDGFSYYASEDGVQNTLFHIARKILIALKEKDDPKTSD